MKQELFESIKVSNIIFSVIKISEELCVFKAIESSVLNGSRQEFNSEGISTYENIMKCQKTNTMPRNDTRYIHKNKEFLDLVQVYGYPDTLSDDMLFDGFNPSKRMKDIKLESQLKYSDFENKKEVPDILWLNTSSHEVVDIKNNKLMNVARNADNLMISETYYSNYESMIDKLIADKIVIVPDGVDVFIRRWDSHLHYINGKVVLSDEDFEKVISQLKVVDHYVDNFSFARKLKELDILKINQHLKSDKQIQEDHDRDNE